MKQQYTKKEILALVDELVAGFGTSYSDLDVDKARAKLRKPLGNSRKEISQDEFDALELEWQHTKVRAELLGDAWSLVSDKVKWSQIE